MTLSRDIRAGAAYVELSTRNHKLVKGLKDAERRVKMFAAGVRRTGLGMVAAGAAVAGPLALATKVFANAGDEIDKMSARTGIGAATLSQYGFAAEQTGSNIQTFEKGIKTMQRSIIDANRGLSTQTEALKLIGLEVKELDGLSPDKQFERIAQAISKVEDPTKKAAVAAQLFGRAGVQLIPLMNLGAEGMANIRKEADDLGLTIDGPTAAAAAELTDKMNIMRRVLKNVVVRIGAQLAPVLIKSAELVTRIAVKVGDFVRRNGELIRTILKVAGVVVVMGVGLLAVSGILAGLGLVMGGITAIITAVGAVVGLLGSALAAVLTPIGLVSVAFVALASVILVKTDAMGKIVAWMGDQFEILAKLTGETLGAIKSALLSGDIELAGKILMKGLQVAWKAGTNELKSIWIDFESFMLKSWVKMAGAAGKYLTIAGEVSKADNFGDIQNRVLDGIAKNAGKVQVGPDLIDAIGDAKKSKLESELSGLLAELKVLNEDGAASTPQDSSRFSSIQNLLSQLQSGSLDLNAGSVRSSSGIFNSAAIGSLQGTSVQTRIEQNTRKTSEKVKQIVSQISGLPTLRFK